MRQIKLSGGIAASITAALLATVLPAARADAGVRSRQYDIVPPFWITPDGGTEHAPDQVGEGVEAAFIFPSLDPDRPAPEFKTVLPDLFAKSNRFHERSFTWASQVRPQDKIHWSVARDKADLKIEIDAEAMARIRRLSWREFTVLQGAFKDWLFDHSNCWLFCNYEERFNDIYGALIRFWRDQVLKDASFETFASAYLNKETRRFALSYPFPPLVPDAVPPATAPPATMHATEVDAGQSLYITWGATAIYPELKAGIASGTLRASTGGISEIRVEGRSRKRLFPAGTLSSTPIPEDKNAAVPDPAPATLPPFPLDWSSLMGDKLRVFLPIYNLFDLHDSRLLTDKAANVPPPYLFLLTPDQYIKADAGPGRNQIAQYTTDGRSGPEVTKAEATSQLARRFILVGCDQNTLECVQGQLSGILDQAYSFLTSGLGTKKTGELISPSYTTGIFTNQTFVEIRNHVSLNGRPSETTVPERETWGMIVSSWMSSDIDRSSSVGSPPMLEIRRTTQSDKRTSETRQLLFHTTASSVLNQAQVFEGDEFYGRPDLPAILR